MRKKSLALGVMGLVSLFSGGLVAAESNCNIVGIVKFFVIAPAPIDQGAFSWLTLDAGLFGGSCANPNDKLIGLSVNEISISGTFFSGDGQQISVTAGPGRLGMQPGPISTFFQYNSAGTFTPYFTGTETFFLDGISVSRSDPLHPVSTPVSGWFTTELFTASASLNVIAAPVPEPDTYALMLGGLGLLGFMTRRKNKNGT